MLVPWITFAVLRNEGLAVRSGGRFGDLRQAGTVPVDAEDFVVAVEILSRKGLGGRGEDDPGAVRRNGGLHRARAARSVGQLRESGAVEAGDEDLAAPVRVLAGQVPGGGEDDELAVGRDVRRLRHSRSVAAVLAPVGAVGLDGEDLEAAIAVQAERV
jgi:hypothetical protein